MKLPGSCRCNLPFRSGSVALRVLKQFPQLGPAGGIPVKRLFHYHDTLVMRAQLYLSIGFAVTVLLGLAYWRNGELGQLYRQLAILCVPILWITYKALGVFRVSRGGRFGVAKLTKGWAVAAALVLLSGFVTKTTEDFSRVVISSWLIIGYVGQLVIFLGPLLLIQKYNLRIGEPIPTLVVGSNGLARHLVTSLTNNIWLPDKVVGVVNTDENGKDLWNSSSAPCLGKVDDIVSVIANYSIRRVYIALPLRSLAMIEGIYEQLSHKNIDIIWVPDIFSLNLLNHSVREIAGLPLLSLSESPMSREGKVFVKAVIDRSVAIIVLVLLSPLMAAIAAAIKYTSPGPVFFKQQRHGWDGRVIEVWKFRSMYVHQEDEGKVTQASRGDARVTPIGRFIRRSSIDELPQLFNVLNGTMSLVGPRPHALRHDQYYSERIKSYINRHRIKPGMTGLAQVNGCRGETEHLEDMEQRVRFDIEYINNWTILLDLQILLMTPFCLFSKDVY